MNTGAGSFFVWEMIGLYSSRFFFSVERLVFVGQVDEARSFLPCKTYVAKTEQQSDTAAPGTTELTRSLFDFRSKLHPRTVPFNLK